MTSDVVHSKIQLSCNFKEDLMLAVKDMIISEIDHLPENYLVEVFDLLVSTAWIISLIVFRCRSVKFFASLFRSVRDNDFVHHYFLAVNIDGKWNR